ncbi:MAG TPA: DUF1015 domain-containing protein [Blastocatellia bacterium]|nr:DUF1015 domain-containing protein [Blastocatellia bacterium]
MAKIYPFRAWRYNRERVGDLSRVLTQPYDKITPEMQERYYRLSEFNLVRLILGRVHPDDDDESNVYTRARDTLQSWVKDGILVPDPRPALYLYDQRYRVPGTDEVKFRRGFIALGQIEDYEAGVVFRHERTHSAPKEDRLRLLRHTHAHCESIFMLYRDEEEVIERLLQGVRASLPDLSVVDEYGVEHLLWVVSDEALITAVQQAMAAHRLVIADGHHRYETALAYRNERRAEACRSDDTQPYERMPMTFFNIAAGGLTILPTHRLIHRLERFDLPRLLEFLSQHFELASASVGEHSDEVLAALSDDLRRRGRDRIAIGMYPAPGDRFYFLTFRPTGSTETLLNGLSPRERSLDVVILHRVILEGGLGLSPERIALEPPITYLREFPEGIRAVASGNAPICFFLNPTRVEQVWEMALAGEVLPQKSTDFYPKLLSGLTIYRLDSP